MADFYKIFRRELDSYLKKRRSKKVSKALDEFYEENFADQDHQGPNGLHHYPDKVMNDIGEGIEKIPEEADKLNIPVTEVAGFCFHRLLSDAIRENRGADREFSDLRIRDNLKNYMEEFEEALGEDEAFYDAAMTKMKVCEEIAKDFNLGDDAVEVSERNVERIKRKINMAKTIRQTFEGEKYEGTENPQKALKAFDEVREMAKEQSEHMIKEKKALLDQDIQKWKAAS